jgi:hypothetical protein
MLHDWQGDRISEISSSDRASFPAGHLGQRLGQFCCADDRCDHPIQQKKQGDYILFGYGRQSLFHRLYDWRGDRSLEKVICNYSAYQK